MSCYHSPAVGAWCCRSLLLWILELLPPWLLVLLLLLVLCITTPTNQGFALLSQQLLLLLPLLECCWVCWLLIKCCARCIHHQVEGVDCSSPNVRQIYMFDYLKVMIRCLGPVK